MSSHGSIRRDPPDQGYPRVHAQGQTPGRQSGPGPAGQTGYPTPFSRPEDGRVLFGSALGSRQAPLRIRYLVVLCLWAGFLGLVGIGAGLFAVVRMMAFGIPGWYQPAVIAVGLFGIALTIAAFVKSDRRFLPWLLMFGSTLALAGAIALTVIV